MELIIPSELIYKSVLGSLFCLWQCYFDYIILMGFLNLSSTFLHTRLHHHISEQYPLQEFKISMLL